MASRKTKASPLDELDTFLSSPTRRTGGGCNTCQASEEITQACNMYAKAYREGRLRTSVVSFWRWLKENTDYHLGHDALRKHLRGCLDLDSSDAS